MVLDQPEKVLELVDSEGAAQELNLAVVDHAMVAEKEWEQEEDEEAGKAIGGHNSIWQSSRFPIWELGGSNPPARFLDM